MTTTTAPLDATAIIDGITGIIEDYANDGSLQNPSYETGLIGFSLYYLLLAKHTNDDAYIPKGEAYFEKAIASLDLKNFKKLYPTDSLDNHLAHIGRFIIFCRKHNLLNVDSDDYLLQLDDILFGLMKSKITVKDFDSGSGAMAAGYYFLGRMGAGSPQEEKIAYLVNSIDTFSQKDEEGDYYWPYPAMGDRVYLGISHGSSLIISFLSQAYQYNIEKEVCKRVIDKAVNFMMKQYRRTVYKGLFPNRLGDAVEPMQFSLCYGDIGNGYALLRAAEVLSSSKIAASAEMILSDCLLRTKEDNLTLDASILYGASGLAIAFDKIAALSGDERFAKRAAYWYEQVPRYAIHDSTFAGFRSRHSNDEVLWNVSYGWGILGIGITLMYFQDPQLPSISELTYIA